MPSKPFVGFVDGRCTHCDGKVGAFLSGLAVIVLCPTCGRDVHFAVRSIPDSTPNVYYHARMARGMTLRAAVAELGITASMLSGIEMSRIEPDKETTAKLRSLFLVNA